VRRRALARKITAMAAPDTPSTRLLPQALLTEIAARGGVKRYPARTVIIHEGDSADLLFILPSGRVKPRRETGRANKQFPGLTCFTGEHFCLCRTTQEHPQAEAVIRLRQQILPLPATFTCQFAFSGFGLDTRQVAQKLPFGPSHSCLTGKRHRKRSVGQRINHAPLSLLRQGQVAQDRGLQTNLTRIAGSVKRLVKVDRRHLGAALVKMEHAQIRMCVAAPATIS